MPRPIWGICPIFHWGLAPAKFDERKQGLMCPCGKPMYLNRTDPKEAAFPERDQRTPVIYELRETP